MCKKALAAFALGTFLCSFADKGKAQLLVLSPFGNHTVSRSSRINLPVASVDGTMTITATPGSDISRTVSSALAAAKSTCGTVVIAPGNYSWNTAGVQMLPCETLTGTGATVLVDVGSSPAPFLIVEGPNPPTTDPNKFLTVGNIRGFTFVGPSAPTSRSSSTGIELGGETSAQTAQLINLYDVHIRGFGCGINIEWAFQVAFFGGSIEANYDGVCFSNIIAGLENLNFHGTQILNNIDYGIDEDQTGVYTELNLISCSLDYNGQFRTSGGEVRMTNGKLTITGGHFENNTLPMITIAVPGAPAMVSLFISGTAFNLTDATSTHAYDGFLAIFGLNDVVEVGRGVTFISQGAAVSAVADWGPLAACCSRLFMDPYTYQIQANEIGLPAYAGVIPNNYSFPLYDIHGNVSGISSSY